MVALNRVVIAGRLTKRPELRKTPGGVSVTDLLVAINRDFVNQAGDKQQETCFVDVVVWGKQADLAVASLDCSSPVLIEGRLQLDTWHAANGEKRSKLRVVAEKVQFLERCAAPSRETETALTGAL